MGLRSSWRSLFGRPGRRTARTVGGQRPGALDAAHLGQFVATRNGVEAYLEPATNVVPPTLLLIASDGEWTRRPVADARAAAAFTQAQGIPLYDVNLTGYPPRMRAWTAQARRRARAAGAPELAG